MNFNENIEKMVKDHAEMKSWHEAMAKTAANSMQDHIKAATWHESQMNLIKAIKEVPLEPEKTVTTIPASNFSASTPSSPKPQATEVPLDPQTIKKMDLISVLNDHVKEHGDFDMDVETIANFLIND